MEVGANSLDGHRVALPAEEGSETVFVTAIILKRNIMDFLAMEMMSKRKDAIFKYVLVSSISLMSIFFCLVLEFVYILFIFTNYYL